MLSVLRVLGGAIGLRRSLTTKFTKSLKADSRKPTADRRLYGTSRMR